MKPQKNLDRKTLKNKMAQALNEDIKTLSNGMQTILLDDLATAFESRLLVLNRAQLKVNPKVRTFVNMGMEIPNETF
jgi:hypothetical protein